MASGISGLVKDLYSAVMARPDSVSVNEIENLAKRDKFSNYLPWLMYSKEKGAHLLVDNTVAYMWELTPLVYQGPKQTASLRGVLGQNFPTGTVMQYVLFPDTNIEPYIRDYEESKIRLKEPGNEVGSHSVDSLADFMRKGTKGLQNIKDVPVRNYRAFLILKSSDDLEDLIVTVEELLGAANLNPRRLNDVGLLKVLDRMINNKNEVERAFSQRKQDQVYTRDKPLRSKVIRRDTVIDFSGEYPKIGDRYAACLTPQEIPESINPRQTNNLFGGIMGLEDDNQQLNFDYTYSCNFIWGDTEEELAHKASYTMKQSRAGSFAAQLNQRVKDFKRYLDDRAANKTYVQMIPTMWVYADTKEQLTKNVSRAMSVWQREGGGDTAKFKLERESSVLSQALYIASLPGGLYNVGSNIKEIDRHYYISIDAAAAFAPVQGDYAGNGRPVSMLIGRKGQICGLDVFAPRSPNSNFIVSAESGAGKSFLLNTFLKDYYNSGEKVRIVDLGRSYEKLCRTHKGKYYDFSRSDKSQCINPLDFQVPLKNGEPDQEDIDSSLVSASQVFLEMVYSKSKAQANEVESQLIKDATKFGFYKGRQEEGTDVIYDYLMNYETYTKGSKDYAEENISTAKRMAYCIKDFTTGGPYAQFFVGPSTFRIADDDFVVVELDGIKGDSELIGVVILQMMNEITQDLYLSDRANKRFILFEEAATLLREQGQSDLSRLGVMVYEGYRRARKYGGAFGVVLQSLMDTKSLGSVGSTIMENAAYKFLLASEAGYSEVVKSGTLQASGFSLELLNSLKNNKPHYSEIFVSAPQGTGVGRLVVDPFGYLIGTTESDDVSIFNRALDSGATPLEATLAIGRKA